MNVQSICEIIEEFAPLALQESYDNAGLLIGDPQMEVNGILICIDITHDILEEAIQKKCNFILSHHPLIFKPLLRIIEQNEIQKCAAIAIKNNLAIYAAHTNLDNVWQGVNFKIAEKIQLQNVQVLRPMTHRLLKLVTFVPKSYSATVRNALFEAGAGTIGNYNCCSFNSEGTGTFMANEQANPFIGEINELHTEPEIRMEVILPDYLKNRVQAALLKVHPYEEPAYDFISLENEWNRVGAGIIGNLPSPKEELDFLREIKTIFGNPVIRYTKLLGKKISKVAICGGAGSSFLSDAIQKQADVYISSDFKYHDFFLAEDKIIIADIGHFESEQFTKEIFYEIITKKIPNFAVQISDINTNPVNYL